MSPKKAGDILFFYSKGYNVRRSISKNNFYVFLKSSILWGFSKCKFLRLPIDILTL